MTESTVPERPQFTEENVERALMDARGDLYLTANLLAVTVWRVDQCIRRNEKLQKIVEAIKAVRSDYDKISVEHLELEVQRRLTFYRADALQSLHDLATMPLSENSAMMQVKFTAAARLAQGGEKNDEKSDFEHTLVELNDAFHRNAKRIKKTRETIEIELGPQSPQPIEVTAERLAD